MYSDTNTMKRYVLENVKEFERLEKQSQHQTYNYQLELSRFLPKETGTILDAGCGSGVVSRYLANLYPAAQVVGCDFSEQRVAQATNFIHSVKKDQTSNLKFIAQNLTQLTFDSSSFDGVVCRYVLEHMSNEDASRALKEYYRCMRPNGKLCVIDIDGLIYNLYPKTPLLESSFNAIKNITGLDLNIGRKLPSLVEDAGFSNTKWEIETLQFQGESLESEIQLIRERFDQAMPAMIAAIGSELKTKQFVEEYFECLKMPGAVLFYNKFMITAEKSVLKIQK